MPMYFMNRYDAAMQLATRLQKYKSEDGVILAVPRGGVPIGYHLARHLGFALDLLMTKKLGHPANEEFAIGAVGIESVIIEEAYQIPKEYIQQQTKQIRQQLIDRYRKFMGNREPAVLKNKIVIVVDDGVATGRTILATLKMLRSKKPKKSVIAVPVASMEAAERIKQDVNQLICIVMP